MFLEFADVMNFIFQLLALNLTFLHGCSSYVVYKNFTTPSPDTLVSTTDGTTQQTNNTNTGVLYLFDNYHKYWQLRDFNPYAKPYNFLNQSVAPLPSNGNDTTLSSSSSKPIFKNFWNFPHELSYSNNSLWQALKQPLHIPYNVFNGDSNFHAENASINNVNSVSHIIENDNFVLELSNLSSNYLEHNLPKNMYIQPIFIQVEQTSTQIVKHELSSDIMLYLRLSIDLMLGNVRYPYLIIYKPDLFNRYINAQYNYHNSLHKYQLYFHKKMHNPVFIRRTLNSFNNFFRTIKSRNYNILYHVQCPPSTVFLKIIIQGKEISANTAEIICSYFRLAVRMALNTFNYNNKFTFIEIPSEWLLTNSLYIRLEDLIVPIHEILNFGFTNFKHNDLYFSSSTIENCSTFNKSMIAHQRGFSIHINNNVSFCFNDVYSEFTEHIFNCSYDLLAVLQHELAHFFISKCHIESSDMLKASEISRVRDLSAASRLLFEKSWATESRSVGCIN